LLNLRLSPQIGFPTKIAARSERFLLSMMATYVIQVTNDYLLPIVESGYGSTEMSCLLTPLRTDHRIVDQMWLRNSISDHRMDAEGVEIQASSIA
jgi:hypothetical protein